MTDSMTGFGRGTAQVSGAIATVELRSVNNRFCDVTVRLPRNLNEYEPEIQRIVKDTLARGRITVTVQVEQQADAQAPMQVNASLAQGYKHLLESLRDTCGLEEPVQLEHLLRFTDIFAQVEETPEQVAEAWKAVQGALAEALHAMQAMRRREGEALAADLRLRLDIIEERLNTVETFSPERVEQARQKLHDRLGELVGDERVDPDRLEVEIALLADKLDVTEECVRLRAHLPVFRDALVSDEPVGRKLNFLSQEINREINTIGSKANDATIAHLVVEMKEELEKIREQVENIQ
jgi:uncharacterized protein (TIGR00255 family)